MDFLKYKLLSIFKLNKFVYILPINWGFISQLFSLKHVFCFFFKFPSLVLNISILFSLSKVKVKKRYRKIFFNFSQRLRNETFSCNQNLVKAFNILAHSKWTFPTQA